MNEIWMEKENKPAAAAADEKKKKRRRRRRYGRVTYSFNITLLMFFFFILPLGQYPTESMGSQTGCSFNNRLRLRYLLMSIFLLIQTTASTGETCRVFKSIYHGSRNTHGFSAGAAPNNTSVWRVGIWIGDIDDGIYFVGILFVVTIPLAIHSATCHAQTLFSS